MVLSYSGLCHTTSSFYPRPQHPHLRGDTIPAEQLGTTGTLTAPWMEDEPIPSSSSPSGSWSSLSVQEDTSSTELVRSGKLLDVNLRRSSAEVSCGSTIKGPQLTAWHQQF